MYIIILLLLYIILSHIYFFKIWNDLCIKYKELLIKYNFNQRESTSIPNLSKNKYYSKEWVSGIMSEIITSMIFSYFTSKFISPKYKKNKYRK